MYGSKGRSVAGRGILPLLFPAIVHQMGLVHSLHIPGSRRLLLRLEVGHRRAVHHSIQPWLQRYHQIQRQGRHRTEQLILLDLDLDHPVHSTRNHCVIGQTSGNNKQCSLTLHISKMAAFPISTQDTSGIWEWYATRTGLPWKQKQSLGSYLLQPGLGFDGFSFSNLAN